MCYINTLIVKTQTLVSLGDLEISIPPTHIVWASAFSYPQWPIIIVKDNTPQVQQSEWGFLPSGLQTDGDIKSFRKQFMTQNATCEHMASSRTFKSAVVNQRCIVPSSGFIEWQHISTPGKKTTDKIPHYIQPADGVLFFMAGLYNQFMMNGSMLHTFTIITTEANNTMAAIHNTKKRMPTLLSANDAATWLSTNNTATVEALARYQASDAMLKTHIIAKNFKDIDDPLAPFIDSTPTQLNLFE